MTRPRFHGSPLLVGLPFLLCAAALVSTATVATASEAETVECSSKNVGDDDNDESCSAAPSEDEVEIALGLNPLPVRVAAVSGRLPNLRRCGRWCIGGEEEDDDDDDERPDPKTPCRMDPDLVPCVGDFYCTTTCALWERGVLADRRNGFPGKEGENRPVTTCPMFKRFDGYVSARSASPCDLSCLLPEIRPNRYPAPTGLGLSCQRGTCYPVSSSLATSLPEIPARLECPCNWFGSDCPDDWLPVRGVRRTAAYGDDDPERAVVAVTITVSREDWRTIVRDHRPGGVIRIVHRDPDSWTNGTDHHRRNVLARVQEQPYALAFAKLSDRDGEAGTLEILTAPPDPSLHRVTRAVAERVRLSATATIGSATSGNVVENLYVNPSIAGFFNSEWRFLLPALRENPDVRYVILMSTGAGLSGTLSALQALLPLEEDVSDRNGNTSRNGGNESNSNSNGLRVHLYHGVRRVKDLPYQEYLNDLITTARSPASFQLTIVESRPDDESDDVGAGASSSSRDDLPEGIAAAAGRGRRARRKLSSRASGGRFGAATESGGGAGGEGGSDRPHRVYVQSVVQDDLMSTSGPRGGVDDNDRIALSNAVFVACGRLSLLEEAKDMLSRTYCRGGVQDEGYEECRRLVGQRFFTNI